MTEDRDARAVLEAIVYGSDPGIRPADRIRALELLGYGSHTSSSADRIRDDLESLHGDALDMELDDLLGEERAIVTEEPGTTRDALEAVVSLGGFPFRLVDTAGIREDSQGVERLGIEVAWRYLKRADHILTELQEALETNGDASDFNFEQVRCLGCCNAAPAVEVNGELLDRESAKKTIIKLKGEK